MIKNYKHEEMSPKNFAKMLLINKVKTLVDWKNTAPGIKEMTEQEIEAIDLEVESKIKGTIFHWTK